MKKLKLKIETQQRLDRAILKDQKQPLAQQLTNALTEIGFSKVETAANQIRFKPNRMGDAPESFQRRYGEGVLHFSEGETIELKLKTDRTKAFFSLLSGTLFVFAVANYGFIKQSKVNWAFLLVFDAVFITVSSIQLMRTRCNCKDKHEELLEMLEQKLTE
jgi:hypothetical protein